MILKQTDCFCGQVNWLWLNTFLPIWVFHWLYMYLSLIFSCFFRLVAVSKNQSTAAAAPAKGRLDNAAGLYVL